MTPRPWQPVPNPVLKTTLFYPPAEKLPSSPSTRDILSGWKSRGMAWLAELGRMELRAVLARLGERPEAGLPRLYQNGELLGRVVAEAGAKLAPTRAATALLASVVQVWPVPKVLAEPLRRWAGLGWEQRRPTWDREDFQGLPGELWAALEAELCRKDAVLDPAEVEGSMAILGLPPSLWRGEWADRVVEAGAQALERGRCAPPVVGLLLRLCDRNSIQSESTPISALHQRLIRAVVAGGMEAESADRARMAEQLLERLGAPDDYPERWRGLQEEKRVLCGWLLEGFMAFLWGPLSGVTLRRPVGKRQDIWALYPKAVADITLILSPEFREKLEKGPEARLLASTKGMVKIATCAGLGKEGCALWVVLREGRCAATVLEWGRMGRFHLRLGAHLPSSKLGTAQSLTWAGWEDTLNVGEGWEPKFREKLRLYGIHTQDAVQLRQAA
jgi:hypothetical protein